MNDHNQYNYVNPNNLSLDWECFVISKSEMLLDGFLVNLFIRG